VSEAFKIYGGPPSKDSKDEELDANKDWDSSQNGVPVESFFSGETFNAESVRIVGAPVVVGKEKLAGTVGIVNQDLRNSSGAKRKQGTHGNQAKTN
jgi:hypothetical protein